MSKKSYFRQLLCMCIGVTLIGYGCVSPSSPSASDNLIVSWNSSSIDSTQFAYSYIRYVSTAPVRDSFDTRKAFAFELLKRQVIADYAEDQGFDQLPDIKKRLYITENVGIAEEYVRRIADLTIQDPTENEIREAFRRVHTEIELKQIFAPSEERITLYAEAIAKGVDFDSLAIESMKFVDEDPGSAHLGWVKWNQLGLTPEAEAFRLQTGDISEPVASANGWHIFKALNKKETFFADRSTFENSRESLGDALMRRRVSEWSEQFTDSVMRQQAIEIYPNSLAKVWVEIKSAAAGKTNWIRPFSESFEQADIREAVVTPDEVIARLNGISVTAEDMFAYLSTYPVSILDLQPGQAVGLVLKDITLAGIGRQTGEFNAGRVKRKTDLTRRQELSSAIVSDKLVGLTLSDFLDYGYSEWKSSFISGYTLIYAFTEFQDSVTAVEQMEQLKNRIPDRIVNEWNSRREIILKEPDLAELKRDEAGIEWKFGRMESTGDIRSEKPSLGSERFRILASSVEEKTPAGPLLSTDSTWAVYLPLELIPSYKKFTDVQEDVLRLLNANERTLAQKLLLEEIGFNESDVTFDEEVLHTVLPFY